MNVVGRGVELILAFILPFCFTLAFNAPRTHFVFGIGSLPPISCY